MRDAGDRRGQWDRDVACRRPISYTPNTTVFRVKLTKAGAPVMQASVTINSTLMVVDADLRFMGEYRAVVDRYDEVYVLDVESGADNVKGVRVDGPAPVTFTAPAEASTIDPTSAVELRWEPEMAEHTSVLINPDGTSLGEVDDVGTLTLPANIWVANPAGSHAIGLFRSNTIVPAGADETSVMSVETGRYLHVCDRPTVLCSS